MEGKAKKEKMMKNLYKSYFNLQSMLLLSLFLNMSNVWADESTMPTCESMGYTETSCADGVDALFCPLDISHTYRKCIVNNTQNKTCIQMGYTSKACGAYQKTLPCPQDNTYVACIDACNEINYPLSFESIDPNAGTYACCENNQNCKYINCKSGFIKKITEGPFGVAAEYCVPEIIPCDEASVGDYYGVVGGQTGCFRKEALSRAYVKPVFGIVANVEYKLVISPWAHPSVAFANHGTDTHIPGISYLSPDFDMDGFNNTLRTLMWANDNGEEVTPASFCYHYNDLNPNATTGQQWYLPSFGEMLKIAEYYDNNGTAANILATSTQQLAENAIRVFGNGYDYDYSDQYWTSTEVKNGSSYRNMVASLTSGINNVSVTRNDTAKVRCVFSWGKNTAPASISEEGGDGTVDCTTGPIHIGDIYYADDTCGLSTDRHKPDEIGALGVIVDTENRLVIYRREWDRTEWGDHHIDTSIMNSISEQRAKMDMSGEENALMMIGDNTQAGSRAYAAESCTSLTEGEKSWFLPSAGQIKKIDPTQPMGEKIDDTLELIGNKMGGADYWTSSEVNAGKAWIYTPHSDGNSWAQEGKDNRHNIRCMFQF